MKEYIEREAVLRILQYLPPLKAEAERIPIADVQEVKRGKWLCINGTIFCSECQGKALYKYNENDNDDFPFLLPMKSKRCPNCGAEML